MLDMAKAITDYYSDMAADARGSCDVRPHTVTSERQSEGHREVYGMDI